VVGVLAVQLCGAAYLPIDAHLPPARQAQLLEQAAARVAVVHEGAQFDLDVLCVPVAADLAPVAEVVTPGDAGDLAYVIFTSGSTGVPKGVMIDHRGALNTIVDINRRFGIGPQDRVLALSSLSFDLSVYDIFGLLAAGGAIVLPPDGDMRDPEHWTPWLARHRVSLFNAVPSFAQMLSDLARLRPELRDLPHLRLMMMSGDWIPVSLPPALRTSYPQCRLVSLGGATEASIWSIWHDITAADDGRRSIPYGRPLDNQRFHVLHADLTDCPDGVPGLLHIGGDGLALGYYGDDDKTAASFIRHPQTGERLYRTGDLGRFLPEGTIEFLGRADTQVKVRGHRIELGEIESVAARHPLVRQAVVSAPDLGDGRILVAYVQLDDGETESPELLDQLRRFCAHALPDYMVPAHVVVLDSIPLSSNGKVDRRALPLPQSDAVIERGHQPPRDALEAQLEAVWRDVLAVPALSIFDNFLAAGGHSLLAARLVARLREALQRDIPIRLLFDHPTIAGLADALRGGSAAGTSQPVTRRDAAASLRPSYAQQRLWFIDQFERETAGYAKAYNLPIVLNLQGALDRQALRDSLCEIVARHDVLRTGLGEGDGLPVPRIDALAELPWREIHAHDEAACQASIEVETAAPFDLATPPLLRALLISRTANDHVLVVTLHHIVTDAWSTGLVLDELQQRYNARVRGLSRDWPEPALQYADFAAWQRDGWDRGRFLDAEAYWLAEFAQPPAPLPLATDRPRMVYKNYAATALTFVIEPVLAASVNRFAQAWNATPFMVFMTAFQLLLHRYTGATDIVVGTDSANRLEADTESMLGFFINQLAIRCRIDSQQTGLQLMQHVRDKTLLAFQHEAMPFDRLVDQLRIARNPAVSPLFQVKLNMHTVVDAALDMDGLAVSYRPYDFGTAHYDLVMTLKADGNSYFGTLQYQDHLFDRGRMDAAIGHFQQVLETLLASPETAVGQLDYLGETQRLALISSAAVRRRYPGQTSLDTRFMRIAATQPDAVALTAERPWTYAELADASDRLAAWLVARVAVGARIGLYLERGANPVIAMLAVLKAGATYVPLDPRSPADRVAMILDDCTPALVLSDSATIAAFPLAAPFDLTLIDALPLPSAPYSGTRAAAAYPAYIIYTSGTTGRPNGVVITHAQVGRLLDACQSHYDFGQDDVWTLFHSYVFDFTVWEIWGALLTGGRVVSVPYWIARSPTDFLQLVREEGVTVLSQTPSAFRVFQRAVIETDALLPRLRWVVFGGEGLELQSLRPWFDRYGDRRPRLVNMYGITETTVHVTYRPIQLADLESPASPIGDPLPDQAIYLLDAHLNPVPYGVDGEIHVGGSGNAMGYLNRAATTADRYLPDPWSDEPGARMYRTGDLARRNAQGELEYVGRIDHQVKIRGHRIETGEVQSHLAAHQAVAETLVISATGSDSQPMLAAYVVAQPGMRPDAAELRRWLQGRVPDYMVPAAIVLLDAFPLTINGKVDRKALPDPRWVDTSSLTDFVAPESETATRLCGLISALLETQRVGMTDNFFEIGGHSLLATQLQSHVRDAFGVDITLRMIFLHPTVGELAGLIETALLIAAAGSAEAGSDRTDTEEFVL
jgi:amino acid adenylation domain-containing protein